MTGRRAGWTAVGAAAMVVAIALLAGPVSARLRQPATTPPAGAPSGPTPSSRSTPGSSGEGVAVWDPVQRRTVTLPPDQAAAAIREYWTQERQRQARPAP